MLTVLAVIGVLVFGWIVLKVFDRTRKGVKTPKRYTYSDDREQNGRKIYAREDLNKLIMPKTPAKKMKNHKETYEMGGKIERKLKTKIGIYIKDRRLLKPEERYPGSRDEFRAKLPTGTVFDAVIKSTVFASNYRVPVSAEIIHDLRHMARLIIPKESKLIGQAHSYSRDGRMNISFGLVVFPNGNERPISAVAMSPDGAAGIKGKLVKNRDTRVLKSVGKALLGTAGLFVGNSWGRPYSLEDQLRYNVSGNLLRQADHEINYIKSDYKVSLQPPAYIKVMLLEPFFINNK